MCFFSFLSSYHNQHNAQDDNWEGAVIFLYNRTDFFLIRRSVNVPTHPDQLAFFGGHRQQGENHPYDVARREFVEESGLDSHELIFQGVLPGVQTKTSTWILPTLAFTKLNTKEILQKANSNGEWTTIMAYPLSSIIDLTSWGYAERVMKEKKENIFYYHLNQDHISFKVDDVRDHLLWGFTAKVVKNLIDLYYIRA